MRTLWAVMRTEMSLAWRRPTFWVVLLLWLLPLALTVLANLGNAAPRAAAPYISEQLVTSLMTWLVLMPLIVGPAFTRDLGTTGETLWTTPLDAFTHLLGVVGGLLLALMPVLLAELAAQSLVGYLAVGPSALLFWRYGPPLLLASTVAALSVAALLALILRRTLLLLLIWVALWVVVFQVNLGFFGQMRSVALMSPANVFFYNLQLSPSLGLGLSWPLVRGLLLWLTGLGVLGVLLAVGAALLSDQRRAVRVGSPLIAWGLLAAVLAGGGWLLHARAVEAQAIPVSPTDIQAGVWQVEEHTLDVRVDRATEALSGSSTLRLSPSQEGRWDSVVLRLNPGLRLTEARDEAGQALAWESVGDSLVIRLAAATTEPVTLNLRWEGALQLPYNDYGQRTGFFYPAFDTPQPVHALLAEGAGYLFRDGDWYPWPWEGETGRQQADQSRVTLHVSGGDALATAPLDQGVAVWEGALPSVLLVLPPAGASTVEGRTLHFGNLGGAENLFVTRLGEMAQRLPAVASALDIEPIPSHIVALPYLQGIVWSGDLLLVPEGTGYVPDYLRRLLVSPRVEVEGSDGIEERATMTALVRSWLDTHTLLPAGWARVRPDVQGVVALAGADGRAEVLPIPGAKDAPGGRWIRTLGSPADLLPSSENGQASPIVGGQDLRTMGNPPLRASDYLDLLALWIAIELSAPEVRDADLAVLLAPPDPSPTSDKFAPFLLRSLPLDFPVSQGQKAALVRALHEWAEEVGRDDALRLVGAVVQEQAGVFEIDQLLAALEQRSGVAIEYGESK